MNEHDTASGPRSTWRDPLSLGFEAHRGLLLLRLRLHDAPKVRRKPRGG